MFIDYLFLFELGLACVFRGNEPLAQAPVTMPWLEKQMIYEKAAQATFSAQLLVCSKIQGLWEAPSSKPQRPTGRQTVVLGQRKEYICIGSKFPSKLFPQHDFKWILLRGTVEGEIEGKVVS